MSWRAERMELMLRDLLVEYRAAAQQATVAASVLFGAERMLQQMNAERARQYIARIEYALENDGTTLECDCVEACEPHCPTSC